ncbi:MAG TPA: hypothetical protein VK179_09770 [Bacteroidales bacterium]|nr:hypothetical protein [Bacteroidales bacterium]
MTQLLTKKFNLLPFDGIWEASFGKPELAGSWLIWGQSGSGKTRFTLQLCKYLSQFGRIAYNSREEGCGPTIQKAFIETGMDTVKRSSIILLNESTQELYERLKRKKSPQIVVTDSVQYSGMNYRDYCTFKDTFRSKLLIFVSHADGKEPSSRTAKSIRYDADVKIRCEGYKAFVTSRYGGGEVFTIWPEGAEQYWGENIISIN